MSRERHAGVCVRLPGVARPLDFDPIQEAGRQWRRHWGGSAVPSMTAVTSIMRAHQILLARLNAALEPFDLTFPRYEGLMLLHLSRAGALPLGKMGVRLQVHPTSVTNIVDGLEKRGYVTRTPHPDDRRTTLATVTAQGRKVAAGATEVLNEMRFGTEPLKRAELETITRELERLRRQAGDFTAAEHQT